MEVRLETTYGLAIGIMKFSLDYLELFSFKITKISHHILRKRNGVIVTIIIIVVTVLMRLLTVPMFERVIFY